MSRLLTLFAALLALTASLYASAAAQTPPIQTVTRQPAAVYAGPGHTYRQVGWVAVEGVGVTLLERNRAGNWVRALRLSALGEAVVSGWMQTADLVPDTVRLSALPVTALPDADTRDVTDPRLVALYDVPLIPSVTQTALEIFERGQSLGNRPDMVTKVGDSLTADPLYLTLIWKDERELGAYDFLEETVAYYSEGAGWTGVAAEKGFTTYAILDPFWADGEYCMPNEAPLACEFRIKQPSVAFIMFGPNDLLHVPPDEYDVQMRNILNETIGAGVIPVLSTFSYHPDRETWPLAVEFNLMLVDMAADYDIPIINLWSAARPLPNYGLDGDDLHMKQSGYRYLALADGQEARYGSALRNLLTLATLDEIRRALGLAPTPQP